MQIKKIIYSILPSVLITWSRRIVFFLKIIPPQIQSAWTICSRTSSTVDSRQTRLFDMLIGAQGITMPDRKMGFGYQRVRSLISLVQDFIAEHGADFDEVQAALADLKQYLDIHADVCFPLPSDIVEGINALTKHLTQSDENCWYASKEDILLSDLSFDTLSTHRHSIRSFSDTPVPIDLLLSALRKANLAPSACNRQSIRVKVITDRSKIEELCSIQKGNRGFGNKAGAWLLLTSDLRAWGYDETRMAYIDAGLFAMNILYSLHQHGIAACTLNANLSHSQEIKLQRCLKYDNYEIPILFIAVGYPPEHFMVCKSRRISADKIVTVL